MNQGGEFYYKLIQEWLGNNNISVYFTYNESKTVIGELFVRTL